MQHLFKYYHYGIILRAGKCLLVPSMASISHLWGCSPSLGISLRSTPPPLHILRGQLFLPLAHRAIAM